MMLNTMSADPPVIEYATSLEWREPPRARIDHLLDCVPTLRRHPVVFWALWLGGMAAGCAANYYTWSPRQSVMNAVAMWAVAALGLPGFFVLLGLIDRTVVLNDAAVRIPQFGRFVPWDRFTAAHVMRVAPDGPHVLILRPVRARWATPVAVTLGPAIDPEAVERLLRDKDLLPPAG